MHICTNNMKSILISIYINIFRISFAQDNHLHEEPYVRFYAMYSLLQNNTVYCLLQLNFLSQEKLKKYYKHTRENRPTEQCCSISFYLYTFHNSALDQVKKNFSTSSIYMYIIRE